MSNEFGYIPESPEQSFGNNKGIFTPTDIYDLTRADKYTNYGQLELIETQTASSDSFVDFTSIQESTYNVHFMTVSITDVSSATYLGIRFYESGVLETASVYQEAYQNCQANGTFSEVKSTARNQIITTQSNAINSSMNIYIYFYNLGDSAKYSFTTAQGNGITTTGTSYNAYFGSGVLPQTSTVNGIRILDNFGNMTGTISLYGIRYS